MNTDNPIVLVRDDPSQAGIGSPKFADRAEAEGQNQSVQERARERAALRQAAQASAEKLVDVARHT